MKPITVSERLMYNTVRLVSSNGSSGTGFFYNFEIDGKIFPTIITNKHVLNNKKDETVTFFLHLKDENDESDSNFQITMKTNWIFHSSKDLCFCFVNPVFEHIKETAGKEVFYMANDKSILATKEITESLSAIEELVMVGYPIGLWDERNNYPVFRKGFTAAHPAVDFNEDGIGLVDMACFPGSSGSPIYILNEGGYRDKNGTYYMGKNRVLFLGVLYAGPQYDAQGNIVVTTIPTSATSIESHTPIMTNLGYYIKADALDEFCEYIKNNPK